MKSIFERTDYTLLAKQKAVLLELLNRNLLNQEQDQAIDGIIGFLDAFQDEAVAVHGIAEDVVFPNN
jgi:hypothetical protein